MFKSEICLRTVHCTELYATISVNLELCYINAKQTEDFGFGGLSGLNKIPTKFKWELGT